MVVVYNACSKSTQERLLAAKFGTESAVETYNFISLVKTLGARVSSGIPRNSVGIFPRNSVAICNGIPFPRNSVIRNSVELTNML